MLSSKSNQNSPVVSVCVQTYQHASYIGHALDSILMQQTHFDFEIVLGEDESTDGTREICIEYAKKYHEKIRLFLNSRKNVIYINGKPTGRWNILNNLKNARGKYIALLPGDDCWTHPLKLQEQIDLLETNPDVAICIHNVAVSYMDQNTQSHPYYTQDPSGPHMRLKPERITTIEDLMAGNFIQTPSVVFRAHLFGEFPDWYFKMDRGDWPLHILNAQHGKIMYIDKIMANYRVHAGGIYSGLTLANQLAGAAEVAITLDKHLSYRYHDIVFKNNTRRFLMMVKFYFANRNYVKSCLSIVKYIQTYPTEGLRVVGKYLLNRVFVFGKKT